MHSLGFTMLQASTAILTTSACLVAFSMSLYGAELAYPEASWVRSHERIQFVLDQYVIRTDVPKNEAHLAQTYRFGSCT